MGVEKFLDAGTFYITYEDSVKLLDDPVGFPTRVIPHDYGWWINVPRIECLEEDGDLQQMKHDGYSDAFIRLMKMAAEHNCWWINLDSDGEDVEGLEQIEW